MTEEEPIVEVWLSGNEVIHLVSDLLDPDPVDKDPRASGRTKKLALKYASLALANPGHRIAIRDHHDTKHAHEALLKLVMEVMHTLKIEFECGNIPIVQRDEGDFTGTKQTGKRFYFIKATP